MNILTSVNTQDKFKRRIVIYYINDIRILTLRRVEYAYYRNSRSITECKYHNGYLYQTRQKIGSKVRYVKYPISKDIAKLFSSTETIYQILIYDRK